MPVRKKEKKRLLRARIRDFKVNRKVRKIEKEWTGIPIEQGAIVDSGTGRVLMRGLSLGRHAVVFLFGFKMMRDNIITHRHPGKEEISFSFQDLRTALFSGAKEMRVATDSCVYVMGMPRFNGENAKEEYRNRRKLAKKIKKDFKEAGFATSLVAGLIKLMFRLIVHGKKSVAARRSEKIKALEDFWRDFAHGTQGFAYRKLRVR